MRAEQIVEYGASLQAADKAEPTPQGTEVLVRISRCGVCHSDVHVHDGYFDMGGGTKADIRGGRKLPFTLGHEIVGEVLAAGPEAEGVKAGDRRVVYPWIGCRECPTCKRGLEHLCTKPRNLGINVDGGFATHVLVAHPRYLLDYTGIPEDIAGPYACSGLTAYGAIKKVLPAGKGDPVLILGAGGVGMMGIQIFKALTGEAPFVADIDPKKRDAAMAAGAAAVFDPTDERATLAEIAKATGGCHAVIDFVGAESTTRIATKALRRGGQAVIVGLFGGMYQLPIPMFPWNGISVGGSYVGSLEEMRELLDLVKAGKVAPIPVDVRPLSAASQSLDDLKSGKVVGRVVLKP
jgi:D-arabinose 1-dehydrogenase-like Zn-dependent alcohol dehydrogenase